MTIGPRTVGALLGACLRDAGVERCWGPDSLVRRLAGVAPMAVADAPMARLLADADGVVGPLPGAALVADGGPHGEPVLRIGARPGAVAHPAVVSATEVADLPALVRAAVDASWERPGCMELALDLPLDAPAPSGARPLPAAVPAVHLALEAAEVDGPIVVLAGPGVVRMGAAGSLRRLAEVGRVGVVNTWGAKGLFDWQSPHHLGTVGLQARDFELAGLHHAGLIVASGVDPAEAPRYRWAGGGRDVGIPPAFLAQVADRWPFAPAAEIARPALYTDLADALRPHYAGEVDGSPAVAVLEAKSDLAPGGVIVADPGPAGLWVARTFPTSELGSVVVPAVPADGVAAAGAVVAAVRGRAAIAVTASPLDATTPRVLEVAGALGVTVDLRVWGPGHDGPGRHVPVDFDHTAVLESVAGPVVAWT